MHAPDNTKEVSEKRARSLRLRVGVPASTGLCKRRAKPESGPRETGRRRSSEGNSSYPTSPACPLRQDFASAGPESEAHSSNSPGTGQNHNFFDINMLEIQGLPGDTNLASPGKSLFAMIMIIRWLQIRGLPGDSYEFCKRSEVLLSSSSERCVLWIFAALNGAFRPRPRGFPLRSFSWVILHNCSLLCMVCLVV